MQGRVAGGVQGLVDGLAGNAEAVGGDVNAVAPGEFVMVARQSGPTLGFQKEF